MAFTTTNLTAAISASRVNSIALVSTTGFAAGQPVKIDNEYMVVTAVTPTAINVRRGTDGSAAVAHDVNAAVVTSNTPTTDFPVSVPGRSVAVDPSVTDDVITIGQDTTITPPNKNTTYLITKGAIANITLNSATAAQLGLTLTFLSGTAFAHVVTYAAGFLGTTNTVATFPTSIGGSLMVVAGPGGKFAAVGAGAPTAIAFTS